MRPAAVDFVRHETEGAAARRRRRLASFRLPYRTEIADLTANWPVGEDLADSFPGLLFALATGYGTAAARLSARRMLDRGEPLKSVAMVLGLPLWLRRIPAQAFQHALPALPVDEEFTSLIVNRVPAAPEECAEWLDRVQLAHRIVGREFALWAGRELRFLPPTMPESDLQWLLAWAWTSRVPRSPGHKLLRTAWTPAMTWKRALEEIALWRRRIDLIGALAGPPRDPWFQNGHALGLDFVHLDTVDGFIAESVAMENCLDQYATHLAYGRVRIFSVRRGGRPIADVELTLRSDEATMPAVGQVRGPRNRRAPPVVWQAVHAWMGAQPFRALDASPTSPIASREAKREFWSPYLVMLEAAGLAERLMREITGRPRRRTALRTRTNTVADALREVLTGIAAIEHNRDA